MSTSHWVSSWQSCRLWLRTLPCWWRSLVLPCLSGKLTMVCMGWQVFAAGKVEYVYQPLGIIVAESQALATHAATMVAVTYGHSAVRRPACLFPLNTNVSSRLPITLWQSLRR